MVMCVVFLPKSTQVHWDSEKWTKSRQRTAEADAEKAAEADEEMVNGGTNEEEAGEVPTAADEEGTNIVSFG